MPPKLYTLLIFTPPRCGYFVYTSYKNGFANRHRARVFMAAWLRAYRGGPKPITIIPGRTWALPPFPPTQKGPEPRYFLLLPTAEAKRFLALLTEMGQGRAP